MTFVEHDRDVQLLIVISSYPYSVLKAVKVRVTAVGAKMIPARSSLFV